MGWGLQKTFREGGTSDEFGNAVGIYGNYAIVGAIVTGTVYWYQRKNDGTWKEVRVVESSVDDFGAAVGIYGNYAIVGGDGAGSEQGIVNIYQMKY